MRLKWLVVLTVVSVQLTAAALVVGGTWQAVSDGVSDNARGSMHRMGQAARDRFQHFMAPAEASSKLLQRLISEGMLGWSDLDRLEQFMIEPLRLNRSLDAIYFGLSGGDFLYVTRDSEGSGFLIKEIRNQEEARRVSFRRRDPEGSLVESWEDPEDSYDPRLRPWFSAATEPETAMWTAPYVFFTSRQPGVSTATAVVAGDDGQWGAVAVDIQLAAFAALLSDLSDPSAVSFIIDRDATIVAAPARPERWPGLFAADPLTGHLEVDRTRFRELIPEAGQPGRRVGDLRVDGRTYWIDLQPFENGSTPWLMAVAVPSDALFGWAHALRDRIAAVTLAMALVAALLILFAWHYGLERPIAAVTARLRRIAEGGLDPRGVLRGPAEFRDLDAAASEAGRRIRDRDHANGALVETLREFEQAVAQSPVGIAILEPDGRVVFANDTYREVVGRDDPLGDLPRVLAGTGSGAQEWLQALRLGRTVREEVSAPRHDDCSIAVLQCVLSPLARVVEEVGRAVLLVVDITAQKRIERQLIEARNAAERSDRAKSAFLAQMSHELRTPLNAIIGFSDVMRSEVFGPIGSARYAEYVAHIDTSARHLKDLIERVLDISRIEQGALRLSPREIDPEVPVREAVDMLRPAADEAGVMLSLEVHRRRPAAPMTADPSAIRQIVVNLISNAVKYSPRGSPVNAVLHGAADAGIEITVADRGTGILPQDLPHVFEPFWQGGSAWNAERAGVGLGLAIVRTLVELHGGEVEIESSPGAGTTVRARLPGKAAPASHA